MRLNGLLATALALTGLIALWGLLDNEGLSTVAGTVVRAQFESRGWFIMALTSFVLLACAWLAVSPYGRVRLGPDDARPEFSTVTWLTMLFAAGMGVGLLYWATAEPAMHYLAMRTEAAMLDPAGAALFITAFHWGLHAWAIYALTGLVIAYFSFRLGCPNLISAPIRRVFGDGRTPRAVGWLCDLMAIVAIAIGLGGSVAMGVFQIREGVDALLDVGTGWSVTGIVFVAMCLASAPALARDLGNGMALLSKAAMAIAAGLLVFTLMAGPTAFIMGGVVQLVGEYVFEAPVHGFRTFTFMDEAVGGWFQSWTLTYMVWWIAWAPFVGVFIARISRGRTIREFLAGVILAPTAFSLLWFGVFGGVGFFAALRAELPLLEMVETNVDGVTFFVLAQLPASVLTAAAVVMAAFLFLVTSVVSAAFVLGMFSTNGDPDPSPQVKLAWGAVLAALGLVMILSDGIDAVKTLISLGALPFVFVLMLLITCLLKALRRERRKAPVHG